MMRAVGLVSYGEPAAGVAVLERPELGPPGPRDVVVDMVERVRGDKAHPASKGYTCEEALRVDY
jgi:hypothetical protein